MSRLDNVEAPAQLGRTRFHPCFRNPAVHLQLKQPGNETDTPRVDTASQTVEARTPRADLGFAELAESARGENFLAGHSRVFNRAGGTILAAGAFIDRGSTFPLNRFLDDGVP